MGQIFGWIMFSVLMGVFVFALGHSFATTIFSKDTYGKALVKGIFSILGIAAIVLAFGSLVIWSLMLIMYDPTVRPN